MKVPEFDKHLKKAGGHIGRNVLEIIIKMKTIVRKPVMIKINKLRLRNLDIKKFTNQKILRENIIVETEKFHLHGILSVVASISNVSKCRISTKTVN